MDVQFEDGRAALIETNRAAETQLPVAVIQLTRRRLNALRAAPDERTLRNWRSLQYRKSPEGQNGQSFMWLNEKWRLVLRLDDQCTPQKVTVVAIEGDCA